MNETCMSVSSCGINSLHYMRKHTELRGSTLVCLLSRRRGHILDDLVQLSLRLIAACFRTCSEHRQGHLASASSCHGQFLRIRKHVWNKFKGYARLIVGVGARIPAFTWLLLDSPAYLACDPWLA
eukprot:6189198-Pleurochrysis_carterae.AAC.1